VQRTIFYTNEGVVVADATLNGKKNKSCSGDCDNCEKYCFEPKEVFDEARCLLRKIEKSGYKDKGTSYIFTGIDESDIDNMLSCLITKANNLIPFCQSYEGIEGKSVMFDHFKEQVEILLTRLKCVQNFDKAAQPDDHEKHLEKAKEFKELFMKYDQIKKWLDEAKSLNKLVEDVGRHKRIEDAIDAFEKQYKVVEQLIARYTKAAQIKVDMISKVTQLIRKHKEALAHASLIDNNFGHKGHDLLTKECHEFKKIAINYCLIRICIYAWYLNREAPNVTINRLIAVLDYAKDKNRNSYELMKNYLWKSEMPFKEGQSYGRLALCFPYPDDDIKDMTVENKLELFAKADGINISLLGLDVITENPAKPSDPKALNNLVDDVRTQLYKHIPYDEIWDSLKSTNVSDEIDKIVEFINKRNRAIFIMLFFQLRGSMRQPYQRESDRIISSVFFRYLQFKAQVMFNNETDDQRTRLAHSLEVAGIAKLISKQLGCNWELAETISLGHDLGHVAFGHSGEEALDDCLQNVWAGRFLHSLQSVKVVALLAHQATIHDQFGINGLCLSRPVIKGIMKHDTDILFQDIRQPSWRLQFNDWGCAFNAQEKNEVEDGLELGGAESQIVYWADKIAYAGHDWEELSKSGIIEQKAREVEHIFKRMHQIRHVAHAHDGTRKSVDVGKDRSSEIDIIRLMRNHMEDLRQNLSFNVEEQDQYDPSLRGTSPLIFEAFEVSERVVNNEPVRKNTNVSPLAKFVDDLSKCKKMIDNGTKLSFFTKEEYKLVFDFFTVAHDMIFLTKTYPRPYKKSDDVLWVLCRYLVALDRRCIVHALQSGLIAESRKMLCGGDETDTRSLSTLRNTEETKRQFREKMQTKMQIRLSSSSTAALNRITDFVLDYYIKSDKLRVMKLKAHKVINELFKFFMEHEDMLPTSYKHALETYAQQLIGYEGDRITNESDPRLLVIQYMRELYKKGKFPPNENRKKIVKRILANADIKVPEKARFILKYTNKIKVTPDIKHNSDIELRNILLSTNAKEDYIELCKHIAKARIVADYIASMTDRYAEKKYNEIVSSSTAWS